MDSPSPNRVQHSITRRELVQIGGAAHGAIGVGSLVHISSAERVSRSSPPGRMAMLIDLRKCFGCQACSVACKSENGVLLGNFRSWVSQSYKGKYPRVRRHFLPRTCNHFEKPACVKVCPGPRLVRFREGQPPPRGRTRGTAEMVERERCPRQSGHSNQGRSHRWSHVLERHGRSGQQMRTEPHIEDIPCAKEVRHKSHREHYYALNRDGNLEDIRAITYPVITASRRKSARRCRPCMQGDKDMS